MLAACGRIGFDATDGAVLVDAPPVPSVVCDVERYPEPRLAERSDLAVAPVAEGLVLVWAPVGGGQVAVRRLDSRLMPIVSGDPPALVADHVGGAADAGSSLVFVFGDGGNRKVVKTNRDLSQWAQESNQTSAIVGRDPFPSEVSQVARVFLDRTMVRNELRMSLVLSDGSLGATGLFTTADAITAIAGDDGPDHGHAVWLEDLGVAGSRCTASDIDFTVPPQMGSMQVISDDCHDIRNASGPPAADSMIIVWTTAAGAVESRYIASSGDLPRTITPAGRSPKVKFDGTVFWIAWIDRRDETLHLATFDLDGTVTDYPLPGWRTTDDEAFELVRRNDTVYLVVLDDPITVMTMCPS